MLLGVISSGFYRFWGIITDLPLRSISSLCSILMPLDNRSSLILLFFPAAVITAAVSYTHLHPLHRKGGDG